MKVGKYINEVFDLVETETPEVYYGKGYKPACESEGEGECEWVEYPKCFIQEWHQIEPEPEPENA